MARKRGHAQHRRGSTRSKRRPGLLGVIRQGAKGPEVETAEGTFKLTQRGMREAMMGDTVTVSLHHVRGGELRAQVESVEERSQVTFVGTYEQAGPLGVVRPLDHRLAHDFFVPPSDSTPRDLGVEPQDMVVARIVSYPSRMESGVVTIERRIGGADAPDLGVQAVMARYDLTDGYPERALAEAEKLELDVDAALEDPLRRDIRDRFAITIDPVDARDFDDAISIERAADGGWNLGVHIADVSHYVTWESSIDLEARRRSTSVYLADRVLPMLPERLSNDLCSLRPGEDRLAFTVDMRLDGRGKLTSARMYPRVISSRVRMDYAAADLLLCDGEADGRSDRFASAPGTDIQTAVPVEGACRARARAAEDAARACGVDLRAFLRDADALACARRAVRHRRGAIDFQTTEVHALLDQDGMPRALVSRARSAATSLVEEAMLLANESVAKKLAAAGEPAAFRVHETPSPDELNAAARLLVETGAIDSEQALGIMAADPHSIEHVLEAAAGTASEPLVNALLLRAMQRAVYRPHNLGHYALAAEAYCHFTSPIRRYPDLLVHRALKMLLARERLGAARARERAPRLTGSGSERMEAVLPALCRQASTRERLADAAAHATQKVKVAQYYASRIGERAAGVVSWIDQMGVFVRLDETSAEGLVRLGALPGSEWWDLDEQRLMLVGSATGRTIELGQHVIVEVAATDVVRGHLDFKLIHAGRV